ncbi:tRNA lysidine(34) synthetase TilS [Chloroflexota bacterium]
MRLSQQNNKLTTLPERMLRFTREEGLIPPGVKLVVGVSGGPDSVCLLHMLATLRNQLGVELYIAHLDHKLRGAEAEADAGYVAELAHKLDIPCTIESQDVKAYQTRHRLSPEEAAREVRYNFLARVAAATGAGRVAVGHTADDNVETILMHLIRGSGTRGLRGLQAKGVWKSGKADLTVIRPLLTVSREETVKYCRHHRLMPRADSSNLSRSPLRNRIRLELLPLLRGYNPGIDEALLRTAGIATDDLAFLDETVALVYPQVTRKQRNTIVLDKEVLRQLPSALQRNLLRACIADLAGDLKDIEARHIEEIIDALDKAAGKTICLPEGLVFCVEYDRFLLGTDPAALAPYPVIKDETTLKIPGETTLPGWQVTAEITEPKNTLTEDNGLTACFDLDKAGTGLTVRARRPGDRFQPLGMSQTKKLNEFMIDAKIPRAWRPRVPVVGSPAQLLWVVGWRTDERARVTEATRQVLRLEFHRS